MDTTQKIPQCVGIIMDGNRRWAKSKGLPAFEGHRRGYEVFKDFLSWAKRAGVKNVVSFAFSLENWKRSEEEVSYLMTLIRKIFVEEAEVFIKEKASIKFIGNLSLFPEDMRKAMKELEEKTAEFTDLHLALAVSYGGRDEIVAAANACVRDGISVITEKDMSERMYDTRLPDPDMIIRTSGEMRISGFLPWQGVYSELFFTETFWPDFSEEEFLGMIREYGERERRMGK